MRGKPVSVGLGGDGDEIAAIDDIEHAFGVKLDYDDAPTWITAGDVFKSLQKKLPKAQCNRDETWAQFVACICDSTGVDPNLIEPTSPLLSESRFWPHVADASAIFWGVFGVVIVAIGLAIAV